MSYVLIAKATLKLACEARIEKAEKDAVNAEVDAIDAARTVWWRQLLRLPLLMHQKAEERLKKISAQDMFGGALGNIYMNKSIDIHNPKRLLSAVEVSETDVVLLSSEDAIRVESWKRLL